MVNEVSEFSTPLTVVFLKLAILSDSTYMTCISVKQAKYQLEASYYCDSVSLEGKLNEQYEYSYFLLIRCLKESCPCNFH